MMEKGSADREIKVLIGALFPFHAMSFTEFCLAQSNFAVCHAVRGGILTKGQTSLFDRVCAIPDSQELGSHFPTLQR
jgi:hypothetical protein